MKTKLYLLTMLLSLSVAAATNLTLRWDPNPASDAVTGYNVYWKNPVFPGAFFSRAGGTTNTAWTWTNIPPGRYAFQVTATNYGGEGLPSTNNVTALIATPARSPIPGMVSNVTMSVTFSP